MTNIISSSSISPLICFFVFFFWLGHGGALGIQHSAAAINGADKIRSQFLHLLRTRRSPQVPLTVEPSKPVRHPLFQQVPTPIFSEVFTRQWNLVQRLILKILRNDIKRKTSICTLRLESKEGCQS